MRIRAAFTVAVAALTLTHWSGSLAAVRRASGAAVGEPSPPRPAQLSSIAVSESAPLGLDLYRAIPADNPMSVEKVALGRRLFHDRRLSRDGTISCATCHDPARTFTNGLAVAVGVGGAIGRRNVPTIVNRVYGQTFFWDGRAASLEEQAGQPLLNPREMATTPEAVVATVQRDADYVTAFRAVFGRAPDWEDVRRALASFVRSVRSGNSPNDRFTDGDEAALSEEEQRGRRLFLGRADCWRCHRGPNLTDEQFHNTGVAFLGGELTDPGRFAVTGLSDDRGAFKTPTLREVVRTAPYMHDGSLATLADVVEFYNRGGNPNPELDSKIRPLELSAHDQAALVAFLGALAGTVEEER